MARSASASNSGSVPRGTAQLGSVSVRLVAGVPALSAEDLRGVRGHAAIVKTKLIDVPEVVSSYLHIIVRFF